MRSSSPASDYEDYLSALKKKTVGNAGDFHIEGLSDFSLSELSDKKEGKSNIQSKFLKKSTTNNKKNVTGISKNVIADKKKKITKENIPKKAKKVPKSKVSEKMTTVNKSDILDSDGNMSFSSLSLTPRPMNSFVPKLRLKEDKIKEVVKSDEDESSFGKDGRKFFKKKVQPLKEPEVPVVENIDLSSTRDSSSPRKSTLRSAKAQPSIKKVTIDDHISTMSLRMSTSLDKSSTPSSDVESISEKESNFCAQKIMSIDDFQIEEEFIEEKIVNSSRSGSSLSPSFIGENILSLADLEVEEVSTKEVESIHTEEKSLTEIRTLPQVTPRRSSRLSRDQSVSEIITVPGTERSSTLKHYSMDFEDSLSKDKHSVLTPSKVSGTSYSSDFTKDDLSEKDTEKESSRKKRHSKDKSSKQLKYQWDEKVTGEPYVPSGLGMKNVDPTPIAQYVVSPEALECVTAYSPCMILLTNMLRQQLQMTTSFIDTQRRLYESMMSDMKPTYHYCTLEDTKQFIRTHRDKRMSIKKAEEVDSKDH